MSADWNELSHKAVWAAHSKELERAIEFCEKAIELIPDIDQLKDEKFTLLNYLASLYFSKGNLAKVRETVSTYNTLPDSKDSICFGDNLLILADACAQHSNIDEAIECATQAMHAHQRRGHDHGVMTANERIAEWKELKSRELS